MAIAQVAEAVFDGHVANLRQTYRARRDNMLARLAGHMPAGVTWTKPEGGMFVWITLPAHIEGAELLAQSLQSARVAFVPGRALHADGSGGNNSRLSFSLAGTAMIDAGIGRQGALIRAQ